MTQTRDNPWCEVLGVQPPDLAVVKDHSDASMQAMAIMALLEHGAPLTIEQLAERFVQAGIRPDPGAARRTLARCIRAPLYRVGNSVYVDAFDEDTELWCFRLGLRQRRITLPKLAPKPPPRPKGDDEPLDLEDIGVLAASSMPSSWSATRRAVMILDALGGGPAAPADVVALQGTDRWPTLTVRSQGFGRQGSPIGVDDRGRWFLLAEADVQAVRRIARERLTTVYQRQPQYDFDAIAARLAAQQAEAKARIAAMRRVIVHPLPAVDPEQLLIIDVARGEHVLLPAERFAMLPALVQHYDAVAGIGIWELLVGLGVDVRSLRLHELSAPQKSVTFDHGVAKIDTEHAIEVSLDVPQALPTHEQIVQALRTGPGLAMARWLDQMIAVLRGFYRYIRLHRGMAVRLGDWIQFVHVDWVPRDETSFHGLLHEAHKAGQALQFTVWLPEPGAEDWSLSAIGTVIADGPHDYLLLDSEGKEVPEYNVINARILPKGRRGRR